MSRRNVFDDLIIVLLVGVDGNKRKYVFGRVDCKLFTKIIISIIELMKLKVSDIECKYNLIIIQSNCNTILLINV